MERWKVSLKILNSGLILKTFTHELRHKNGVMLIEEIKMSLNFRAICTFSYKIFIKLRTK